MMVLFWVPIIIRGLIRGLIYGTQKGTIILTIPQIDTHMYVYRLIHDLISHYCNSRNLHPQRSMIGSDFDLMGGSILSKGFSKTG